MQGRIGEIILSGMSLYLGIFSRVWLKSISITVMSRLRDSKMAIAWLGVGRVFLFFPPVKIRKSESRVMPMKLAS